MAYHEERRRQRREEADKANELEQLLGTTPPAPAGGDEAASA
jgi:hypothetical protein